MLDLREVAKNFDAVVGRLESRGGTLDWSQFKALFGERKTLHIEVESLAGARNRAMSSSKSFKADGPRRNRRDFRPSRSGRS